MLHSKHQQIWKTHSGPRTGKGQSSPQFPKKLVLKNAECQLLSCVQLFATPWTAACQAPVYGVFQGRILEWVAIPFSKGSSQLRDKTLASCIAGRFFMVWATREAHLLVKLLLKDLSSPNYMKTVCTLANPSLGYKSLSYLQANCFNLVL